MGTPLLTRGDIFDIMNVIRMAALRACRRSTKSILVAEEQHGRCDLTLPVLWNLFLLEVDKLLHTFAEPCVYYVIPLTQL